MHSQWDLVNFLLIQNLEDSFWARITVQLAAPPALSLDLAFLL